MKILLAEKNIFAKNFTPAIESNLRKHLLPIVSSYWESRMWGTMGMRISCGHVDI